MNSLIETQDLHLNFLQECEERLNYQFQVVHIQFNSEFAEDIRGGLIVLTYKGVLIKITDFHKYCKNRGCIKTVTKENFKRLNTICSFLNEIMFENFEEYRIDKLTDITERTIQKYCNSYESRKGKIISSNTMKSKLLDICNFMVELEYAGFSTSVSELQLFKTQIYSRNGKLGPYKQCKVQVTKSNYSKVGSHKDLSEKALGILISLSYEHMPQITLAIILQAYAGLRAGEICNVRCMNSPFGPGVEIGWDSFEVDLRKKYCLRDDGRDFGHIKRERKQSVYPKGVNLAKSAYTAHIQYIRNNFKESELDSARPLFVNRYGKGLIYKTYLAMFERLVNTFLVPALLQSEDIALQMEGHIIKNYGFTPHALRHYFSVMLALEGLSDYEIQAWRGDSSPESAMVYLKKKGKIQRDILNAKERANEQLRGDLYG